MPKGAKGTGTGDPKVRAEFLKDISEGKTQSSAAAKHKLSARSFRSRAQTDEEFARLFAEAKNEGAGERADYADLMADTWALADDASDNMRTLWLRRWNPAFHAPTHQRVELSGPGGRPLEVTSPDVAAAIERFTASVVSLAQRGRAELPPGDADSD